MATTKFYFDDEEGEGPSRETSHPNFVKALDEEFYYDCTDEFSPFGNDDGSDTLSNLEDFRPSGVFIARTQTINNYHETPMCNAFSKLK